jgi:hypothetical protein
MYIDSLGVRFEAQPQEHPGHNVFSNRIRLHKHNEKTELPSTEDDNVNLVHQIHTFLYNSYSCAPTQTVDKQILKSIKY